MKRTAHYSLILITALFCAMLASCASGPLTQEQATANALATAAATVNGYLIGGKAGAILGFTNQEVKNLNSLAQKANAAIATPVTSSKEPVVITP
jgi:hypothetical protein